MSGYKPVIIKANLAKSSNQKPLILSPQILEKVVQKQMRWHELIIDQLVGFLVVEPTHQGSNLRFSTDARIFLDLF